MTTAAEVLLALLATAGLFALGWILFGRFLSPIGRLTRPVWAILPASGAGEDLERTVNNLLWLQSGNLARFRIVIADAGLSDEGLATALALRDRTPGLTVCPLSQVEELLTKDST